jgi:hypothetical protein
MNTPTTAMVLLDQLDAIELAEICEHISDWLAIDRDAAARYDRHIGQPGQAGELRRDLARLATRLTTTAVQP